MRHLDTIQILILRHTQNADTDFRYRQKTHTHTDTEREDWTDTEIEARKLTMQTRPIHSSLSHSIVGK